MKITKSELRKMIREQLVKEQDVVPLPSQVKIFMNKFTNSVSELNLSKPKIAYILLTITQSLGLDPRNLMMYIQKIRKNL